MSRYEKTNWVNYPVKTTPINAQNLNNIENGIEDNDNEIVLINTNIGSLENLETTEKTSLVGAINEVKDSIPTKTSDLTNDANFIDNTVNDLVNYTTTSDLNDALDDKADKATTLIGYGITDAYTKSEVDTKLSSVYRYKGSVVTYNDLPSTNLTIGDVYNVQTKDTTHHIKAGDNVSWNGVDWDILGGEVDLSDYYNKTQTDTLLNNKVDKVTGKGLSTNDYTTAEKTKLAGIETGAEVNTIETIKLNGTAVTPDANRAVDITVDADDITYDNTSSGMTASNVQDAVDELQTKLGKMMHPNVSTGNDNTGIYMKLCKINCASHRQGRFVYLKIFLGDGQNGRTNQNAYIDLVMQSSYDGNENGRFGCNWVFHPLQSPLNLSTVDIVVTSNSRLEYEVWLYAKIRYCNPSYSYYCDTGVKITNANNVKQTTLPVGTDPSCNIYGELSVSVNKEEKSSWNNKISPITVNAEDTDITLNDTIDYKINTELKGNTSQKTLSGKNLLNYNVNYAQGTTTTLSGVTVTFNDDGSITLNGTMNENNIQITGDDNKLKLYVDNTKTYYSLVKVIGGSYTTSGTSRPTIAYDCKYNSGGSAYYRNYTLPATTNSNQLDVTGAEYITRYRIWQDVSSGNTTFNNFRIQLAVYQGDNTTEWEEYCGGTTSPNPNYPQDVNVVKGDNTIKVNGKSLLNGISKSNGYVLGIDAAQTVTRNGITYTRNTDQSITISGTSTGDTATIMYGMGKNNVATWEYTNGYILPAGDYKIVWETNTVSDARIIIWKYTPSGSAGTTEIKATSNTNLSGITTITLDGETAIGLGLIGGTTQNTIKLMVISASETNYTYEPYQSQNYSINLGDIELCKINDYQDYIYKDNGKWYLHKEVGKAVIDGSESDWSNPSANRFNLDNYVNDYLKSENNITYFCDNYTAYNQTGYNGGFNNLVANVDYGFNFGSSTSFNIRFKDTRYTSASDFKTWLSTHNTIVYYVLATPTDTEITYQPLIDQLNALDKAKGYNEQTHIMQENADLPFIIYAEQVANLSDLDSRISDLYNIIDSLKAQIQEILANNGS